MFRPKFEPLARCYDPVDETATGLGAFSKHATIFVAHEAGDFVEQTRVLTSAVSEEAGLFRRGPFLCAFSLADFKADQVLMLRPDWDVRKVLDFCATVREVVQSGHCLSPSEEERDLARVREVREAFNVGR